MLSSSVFWRKAEDFLCWDGLPCKRKIWFSHASWHGNLSSLATLKQTALGNIKSFGEMKSLHHRGLECKNRMSRDTWSNRQIWPWSTKWSREKPNRVLPREISGPSKHSSNNTREDSTHGHHQMVYTKTRLIIFLAAKDGEALYSQQKQDQELTVAQIMNSLLPNSDLNWRK